MNCPGGAEAPNSTAPYGSPVRSAKARRSWFCRIPSGRKAGWSQRALRCLSWRRAPRSGEGRGPPNEGLKLTGPPSWSSELQRFLQAAPAA